MKKLLLGVEKLNRPPKQNSLNWRLAFYSMICLLVLLFSNNVSAQTTSTVGNVTTVTWTTSTGTSLGTAWAANTAYTAGSYVYHTDGKLYRVTVNGTSGPGPFASSGVADVTSTLSGVAITSTAGQCSYTSSSASVKLMIGDAVTITGTLGGTGTITGYATGKVYTISAVDETAKTFTLTLNGAAIVTTAGTPTGLTYTHGLSYLYMGAAGATSQSWTPPAGVTSVQVEAWGAGGAGGSVAAATAVLPYRTAGGGGAGSYVKKTIAVNSSTSYNVVVGNAGYKGATGSVGGYFGNRGGKSEFSGTGIDNLTASGGTGGNGSGSASVLNNPGGVLGGLYGFVVLPGSGINYSSATAINLTGGSGSGVTSVINTSGGGLTYIAPTNQGSGYTANPTVTLGTGSGTLPNGTGGIVYALVNPNINSSGTGITTTPGANGSNSGATASGAGGASPDGLGGTLAGGAAGTGTGNSGYAGATATNIGSGGGGGFSIYTSAASSSGQGGSGANGKIVITYTLAAPTVTTTAVISNTTGTTASSGGTLSSQGNQTVTAVGVCWNTAGTPTTADSNTSNTVPAEGSTFSSSITGLSPNTTYYVRSYATNATGTSYGAEVTFTTPSVAPNAPTIGTATVAGVSGQATVSFTAPAYNGGAAITSYTATSNPGGITGTLSQAGSGTITVTGLTNGTAYTFTVTATNTAGTGSASSASNSVTPYALTAPDAPSIVSASATGASGQASVVFTAPAFNGNSTITSYTATSSPDNITGTLTQAGSGTIIVNGLTDGTAYTFTVTATNAIGTGAPSSASDSVTPVSTLTSQTITFGALSAVAYGDSSFDLGATASSSLTVSYSSSDTSVASVSGSTVTILKAGSTIITASQAGDSSYALATPVNQTLVVNPKALSITTASIASKIYNSSSASGAVTPGTLSGFVGSETVTATATGVYANANVDTGKSATITYVLANGTNGGLATNYSLASDSATGDITPFGLTVTGVIANNKVADGTTTATLSATGSLSGVFAADAGNVTLVSSGYSANFADAIVGTAKAVTITGYTITGSAIANYSLVQPTAVTANITAPTTFYFVPSSGTDFNATANWWSNSNGSGANPTVLTAASTTYNVYADATTTAALTLGLSSKIVVGVNSRTGVTLTIASGFGISGTIDANQSSSSSVPNSVVVKEFTTQPTFGTLHDESEVHYQNASTSTVTVSNAASYGKFITDSGSAPISFTGINTIRKFFTVASGSICQLSGTSTIWNVVNSGAIVTINGKLQSTKAGGIFSFGVNTPASANGCLQFVDAAATVATNSRLVLDANSTVEYNRSSSSNQTISTLPINYANLTISDTSSSSVKSISGTGGTSGITVNGTLTLALFTSPLSGTVTMANGSTIVVAGTNSFTTAPTLLGNVNLSYTPVKLGSVASAVTISSTAVTLVQANANISVGLAVSGTGIAEGTTVSAISGTALTLSTPATATGATITLTFEKYLAQTTGNEVPTDVSKLNNLTINNTSGVTLGGNATVNAALTFTAGKITTSTNTLTLGTAGTISGAASGTGWVVGNLKKLTASGSSPTFTYAIGDATNYLPLALTFSGSTSAAGGLTAKTTSGDHASIAGSGLNSAKSVNRTWTLTNDALAGFGTYGAAFKYVSTDNDAGTTPANYAVRNYNGSTWAIAATSGTTTTTDATATGITGFGDFVIGECVPTTTGDVTTSICAGATYVWPANGQSYTTAQSGTTYVSGCNTATLNLTITPNVTPTFTAVADICYGGSLSALPTTSNNGITGTWLPALNNTATTEYTFTPTAGQCATTATLAITVNALPAAPSVLCYQTATWNGATCSYDVTGTQPTEPAHTNCWDTYTFVGGTTCAWVNNNTPQPTEPAHANCWDTYTFNTTSCSWENNNTPQPTEPAHANCWDTYTFNTSSCSWVNNNTPQPTEPAHANCWDNYQFQNCAWVNTGTNPGTQPSNVNCWDNYQLVNCVWTNTGTNPGAQPSNVNCWDDYQLVNCVWTNTGTNPGAQPSNVNCWDNYQLVNCAWVNTGTNPGTQPSNVNCWDNYQLVNCAWVNTGTNPGSQPQNVNCWDNYQLVNCAWVNTGTNPGSQPQNVNCWDNYQLVNCAWVNTGTNPGSQPSNVNCWDNYQLVNCAWVNQGTQPAAPNAGTDGTLSVDSTPTNTQLFAALTGANEGGSWTHPAVGFVGVHTYTVTQAAPCSLSDSATVTVTAATLGAPVVANTSICKGTVGATPSATALSGYTLLWYTAATGGTPLTATPVITTTTKTYWVAQKLGATGPISPRAQVTTTVNNLPATPSALTSLDAKNICKYIDSDTPVLFSATATGASSYIWTTTIANITAGDITNDGATALISFKNASTTPGLIGSVLVQIVDANGCVSLPKALALTTALPTAPTSLVMTSADSTPHFKGAAVVPATVPVTYTTVGLNTLAKITKVGPYMGTETVFTLTAPEAPTAASYAWTLNGATQRSGGNGRIITVDFSGVEPGIGSLPIVVQSVGGCGSSTARTLTLARALPTAPTKLVLTDDAISTTTAVTKVGPYTDKLTPLTLTATPFTTQGGTATSYAWVLPAGVNCTSPHADGVTPLTGSTVIATVPTPWTITDYITTTTSTITINLDGVELGVVSLPLSVYSVNGAGNSIARTLTLTAAAPATPAIVGSGGNGTATQFGSCSTKTYTATLIPGATYNWTVPAGATYTGGTGNVIVVDYSATTVAVNGSSAVTCSATNGTGTSAVKSLTVKRIACTNSRLAPEAAANGFSVKAYPNPSSSTFTIETSAKGAINAKVYDMQGRLVENANSTQVGSRLAAGVYNVIVSQGANTKSVRVIKQ